MLARSFRPILHGHRLPLYLKGSVLLLGFTVSQRILPNLAQVAARIDPETHVGHDGVMVTPASPESLAMLEQARAKTNQPTGEQRLLQRSRHIAHGLEKDTGTIHTQVIARTQTALQIHCVDDDGTFLATMTWNRATGELIQVSHRIRRERSEALHLLSPAQAKQRGIYWLKTTGVFSAKEGNLQITPTHASEEVLGFLVRCAKRAASITVDRQSGELVNAILYRDSGLALLGVSEEPDTQEGRVPRPASRTRRPCLARAPERTNPK